jgi:hypothetical protein
MLKSFCLIGAFLGFLAAGCMIPPETIPEGVCPERVPFYGYEYNRDHDHDEVTVCRYSLISKINVPIDNGSKIVTIEEGFDKSNLRIYGLTQKLERFQLKDKTIPLVNKLIICDAIMSTAQNIVNTFNYWTARGFNGWDRAVQLMTEVKALMIKTHSELVASDNGCVEHEEIMFHLRDTMFGCDTIDDEPPPDGVYPNDLPRRKKRFGKEERETLMRSIFFKLITPEKPEGQKTNLVEGMKILNDLSAESFQNLDNPSISQDEKLIFWKAVLTSANYAYNAVAYWRKKGFYGQSTHVALDVCWGLKELASKMHDELSKSESGCIANRIFDYDFTLDVDSYGSPDLGEITLPIPPQPEVGGVARPSKDTVTLPILTQPKVGRVARSGKDAVNPPFRKVGSSRLTPLPPLSSAPPTRRVVKSWSSDSD